MQNIWNDFKLLKHYNKIKVQACIFIYELKNVKGIQNENFKNRNSTGK
jgi:hypothetical protein